MDVAAPSSLLLVLRLRRYNPLSAHYLIVNSGNGLRRHQSFDDMPKMKLARSKQHSLLSLTFCKHRCCDCRLNCTSCCRMLVSLSLGGH